MDLIDRINANYNNLSRVHKRIVDYITDNPDRACFQSLKDFSDSVSASPVTVPVSYTHLTLPTTGVV